MASQFNAEESQRQRAVSEAAASADNTGTHAHPAPTNNNVVLGAIGDSENAFSHVPEHGFSLFLANRTKTIHFVRHAEGQHNAANREAGDDTPVTYSTPGAWAYQDAKLTPAGIQQCVEKRQSSQFAKHIHPELVVVSPFTRTLQTAHILFGGKGIPFMVHDLCRERSGQFTCDKRRPKTEIMKETLPMYQQTNDAPINTAYGYPTEEDENWTEEREPPESVIRRNIAFMEWLASRPEREIAVVTHSSWLKHLFRHDFGSHTVAPKDKEELHRLAGNAEVRSVCLALHRGFYPPGTWDENDTFIPTDQSFRRGRWAPNDTQITAMHQQLLRESKLTA
ncbi:hypothetical protein ACA910_022075 [Epithemia clementina (nom. ined.)]